ncbi:MAG: hypothetical protein JW987_03255 [Anaerolineaceae bacterium]|nr:hypothetical protein [Anaerolineaceae bacterium]
MKIILRRLWLVVFLLGILLPANAAVGEARSAQADMVLPSDWTATGTMNARRAYFTLSVLPDGKALAAGGYYNDGSPHYLNSSEIYDPLTNTWVATDNSMTTARRNHTATVLLDGRVLVAGGESATGTETNTAEIFDPATGLWTVTGSMNQKRYGHTATRLQDGRVLVVGGCFRSISIDFCTVITEIYDPASGTWQTGTAFPTGQARMNHTATLLQDGSVLVAGGYRPATTGINPTPEKTFDNAYRFYPAGNNWAAAGTMTAAPSGRSEHSAVVRRDGKVLIVGGHYSSEISNGYVASTEIYDPNASSNPWTNLNKPLEFGVRGAPSVLDANGNYILLGGEFSGSSSDVYYMDINNPSDTWHRLYKDEIHDWNLTVQRSYHAAAVLPGGVILVAGGFGVVDGPVVNSAETNRFTSGAGAVGDLRTATFGFYRSSATLMPNGDVMITGGAPSQGEPNPEVCHNLVSFWDFEDDTFPEPGPAMIRPRCNHSTILLPDGRVLVLGGTTSIGESASGTGEIFDGVSWTRLIGPEPFDAHQAVLLPDGKVFIMQEIGRDSYIFDPVDLSFRLTQNQAAGTYNGFTATLMKNGKVLILGSRSSETVEVFDPLSETFTIVPRPSPLVMFNNHDAVLLPDGRVMVSGGGTNNDYPRHETYLFNPQTNSWTTGSHMISGRQYHQMLVLPDGRPVVIGGNAKTGEELPVPATTKIEIYDPADNAWHSAGDMFEARRSHEALLTLTGQIMIIGGLDEFDAPLMNVERFSFPNISTALALWQPTVTDARCVDCNTSRQIEVTGSDFTEAWEGSGGLTNQSAANQPLVQIIRLDNGQMEWLRPGAASSDGRFLSEPIPGFPDGPAMVFVYVNGSFQGKVVMISAFRNKVYLPMLRR